MSIIYDALKKTEKNVEPGSKPQPDNVKGGSKFKFKSYYLVYILVIAIGLFIANWVFDYVTKSGDKPLFSLKPKKSMKNPIIPILPSRPSQPAQPRPSPAVSPKAASEQKNESREGMVLKGVFFSQSDGYALINDTIVKIGDTVDGAVVKKISLDLVELERDGTILRLYNR